MRYLAAVGAHHGAVSHAAALLTSPCGRMYSPTPFPICSRSADAIGQLGTWIAPGASPAIDFLVVASPEQQMPRAKPAFWEVALHEAGFLVLCRDYTTITTLAESRAKPHLKKIKVDWFGP